MEWIVLVGVLVLSISLFSIGLIINRDERTFEAKKKRTTAKVVRHQYSEHGLLSLIVEIEGYPANYSCMCNGIRTADYPVGMSVDVYYAERTIVGFKYLEVQLVDNPPTSRSKIGNGMIVTSVVLAVAAIVTFIIIK